MMNFDLPEEYQAFQDTVHRWVEQQVPKAWARELARSLGGLAWICGITSCSKTWGTATRACYPKQAI
jgi:hypothetical protein